MHGCKSFICFGINVDFVLGLCLVGILVSLIFFVVRLFDCHHGLLIRGLSLCLSFSGFVCFIEWLIFKIRCNGLINVFLCFNSIF